MAATDFPPIARAVLMIGMLGATGFATLPFVFSGTSRQNGMGHWLSTVKVTHDSKLQGSDAGNAATSWAYTVEFQSSSTSTNCRPELETIITVTAALHTCYDDSSCAEKTPPTPSLHVQPDDSNFSSGTTRASLLGAQLEDDSNFGSEAPVRPDYRLFDGAGYYQLHSEKLGWWEAKETCEAEDAHLAVIGSKEEEDALKQLTAGFKHDDIFIGFKISDSDEEYQTVLGDPLDGGYVNWEGGRPRNDTGSRCGVVRPSGHVSTAPCSLQKPFICQLPADLGADACDCDHCQ